MFVFQEIKERLRRQSSDTLNSVSGRVAELGNSIRSGLRANQGYGFFGNALANIVVIAGFVAFMYIVRYVLVSIREKSEM